MSATFWNMRRRRAAEKAKSIEKSVEKPVEAVEKSEQKPKKGKVKKNG